jgi:hypothetical protein
MRRSRMLGWDRNPLRRRIDRVEAAMVAGLIAVFLISVPGLAAVAGHWAAAAGMREQRTEMAWRLVPATVLGSTRGEIPSGPAGQVWMPARWTARMGRRAATGFRSPWQTRQVAASGCGSTRRAR